LFALVQPAELVPLEVLALLEVLDLFVVVLVDHVTIFFESSHCLASILNLF
jgi:hypothetical protein